MITINQTPAFKKWIRKLRDFRAKARILFRLTQVEGGNLGDYKSVGEGVSEMRIDYGPGYRLYFARNGDAIVILLIGGDKSTLDRDIEKAKAIWRGMQNEKK
ncbi:type II toxin-antitoxin system RelE/ParE family toxin [Fibrobacter sp.]|uniref:type II toxin-antitoxin system RelE/ParE family toxin n=1 Tax=Fibrobacter sp. TaxID=35828 RepID=UPI0025E3F3C8|nr:type II toxin-antitoxin system RelE/ParE family toxin [Fibrobacter sp.]MDD7497069.1 type II toxin-antitoxin system RelE/ParE family toxin [Fibrobacter sp.]MDY5725710.1 type II toxin-antitoxin system RelE/ParE family toxin [Fibrobacter sp.]